MFDSKFDRKQDAAISNQAIGREAMDAFTQRAWVEVDQEAIAHNVRQLKQLLALQTELMAVVKADAYGHGAVKVAQTVLQAGANWLGVATIPEGIELRQAGIHAPILVLGATHTPEQIRAIAHWQLQPTLCSPKQALIFSETLGQLNQSLPVHIKLDTGMSRLGVPWQQAAEFVHLVRSLPHLSIVGVYSHLATAENLDQTFLWQQQQRFEQALHVCGIYPDRGEFHIPGISQPRLHLANSAAALTSPALHYDLVRLGLAIYGLYPAPHLQSKVALLPALQVRARVTQVKTIPAGSGVSYGHQFVCDRELRIAIVGIGYADGVPRNLSNRLTVLVRGQKIRQIGAITMDQIMLDISSIPNLQEGEVVTLLGVDGNHQITADDWAGLLGSISWEILCGFKHRLPRIALNPLPEKVGTTRSRERLP
ncbi:MAG: alanine racemase [Scytolyngbya sp. HA4215-MV1]|jgi:alanine racemase|nr:alanine racemase [Scytolyngbya sp. HA4215-MV1]